VVIEIKDNNSIKEYSRDFIRNKEKYFTAQNHFETLNAFLKEKKIKQKYFFHFCSPKDY
jgi:type III restriction enzyme